MTTSERYFTTKSHRKVTNSPTFQLAAASHWYSTLQPWTALAVESQLWIFVRRCRHHNCRNLMVCSTMIFLASCSERTLPVVPIGLRAVSAILRGRYEGQRPPPESVIGTRVVGGCLENQVRRSTEVVVNYRAPKRAVLCRCSNRRRPMLVLGPRFILGESPRRSLTHQA